VPDILADLQAALTGRYRIERELGRGGMATVYLAHDLRHDRPVALKVLKPELAYALGPERFLREIRLAARLQHPHILSVYDSGAVESGRGGSSGSGGSSGPVGAGGPEILWFTMPYVEGETLRARLAREKQLPVDEALRLTREVALALDYAHRQGVIHRDIKPENILLSDNQALVADFGISRAVGGRGDERLTDTGVVVGTPAYMSPEQAAGERELDGRTDVYSLGAVLYEMLAGEPPYTGATPQVLLAKRLTGDIPHVSRVRSAVPAPVERALEKALASNPADRFPTPAEFARALPASSTHGTEIAAPPRLSSRRALPLRLTLLGLGLAAAIALVLWFARNRRSAAGPASPSRLAVLPFENLGAPGNDYIADGITDAVRGKLISVPGIQVIARSSSTQYKKTPKSPQQIGRELDVQYLLTGTVRWDEPRPGQGRLQVSPELIDVAHATAKWQQPFDAPLTDVFQVQADIAGRVAGALGVALGAGERQALSDRPTANLEAYDAFLRGEQVSVGLSAASLLPVQRAIPQYARAVALDSSFAPAWAQLSRANSLLYFRGTGSAILADAALRAAERALALAPDRPEGYLALGDYHANVSGEYQAALKQYGEGRRLSPANADLLTATALAEQRLGNWDQALNHLEQARRLDPRAAFAARRYAYALLWLRRIDEARAAYDRALALDPANLGTIEQEAMLSLMQGDLAGARAVIRAAPREVDTTELVAYVANYWDLVWLLDDQQRKLLVRLTPEPFGGDRGGWGLSLAQGYALSGRPDLARAYGDSARIAIEAEVRQNRSNTGARMYWAMALAYAERTAEAVREGERVIAERPLSRDSYIGAYNRHMLARIYLMAGKPDQAIAQLEELHRIPYFLTPGWLRIDPTFQALRGNPRFMRLVGRAGNMGT
jgi:serine/threonine protein kinase/tetratricopeptide (TPR) repeat protein